MVLRERSTTFARFICPPKYRIASLFLMTYTSRYTDTIASPMRLRHTEMGFGENGRMAKLDIRQIFARNLREAVDKSATFDNPTELAKKAGMSHSHLSEVLRGITSITIDKVNDLADALKMQPWELLADSETTRQAAMAQMLWGSAVSNEKVEKHYPTPPAAPIKEVAPKRKKSRRKPQRGGANHPGHNP